MSPTRAGAPAGARLRRGSAAVVATLLAATTLSAGPAAKGDPVDAALGALRSAIAKAGCVETTFTQTYVPAGFSTGRGEQGRLVLGGASRIRFDYDQPAGRTFAIDGDRVVALDPASKTAIRRTLSPAERARYPLFDLTEGRRPTGFRLELRRDTVGEWLLATPESPDEDLASGRVLLGKGRAGVRRVEWTDGEGNLNRFELEPMRARKDCGADVFSPKSPAGFRQTDQN